jgi:hypothetical protein
MKKRLSYFPYNERSRSSWTLSTPRHLALSPIRSSIKTVTYVSGTFVTLVSGPYREDSGGGLIESAPDRSLDTFDLRQNFMVPEPENRVTFLY